MYRSKVKNAGKDRKMFSRTADKVHSRNYAVAMRGGIRL